MQSWRDRCVFLHRFRDAQAWATLRASRAAATRRQTLCSRVNFYVQEKEGGMGSFSPSQKTVHGQGVGGDDAASLVV